MAPLLQSSLLMGAALALDRLLGEPQRWHPLTGFGQWALALEHRLYAQSRLHGVLALGLALAPCVALAWYLSRLPPPWNLLFLLWSLYFALGLQSLHDHVHPIGQALDRGDRVGARRAAARIVSRDAEVLDVLPATCESVLENGNDGVLAALFWFMVAGAPGVIGYRLVNTLDAMWGYKSPRYLAFGWGAARLDDLLGWIPARLTALTYSLMGQAAHGLVCWQRQAHRWDSPNAGPVMAAGAGALNIRLGGPARYNGIWHRRPRLGCGHLPVRGDIDRCLVLVRHSAWLWTAVTFVIGLMSQES